MRAFSLQSFSLRRIRQTILVDLGLILRLHLPQVGKGLAKRPLSLTFALAVARCWLCHLTARSTNPVVHGSYQADPDSPDGRISSRAHQLDSPDRGPGLDDGLAFHQGGQQERPSDEFFLPTAVPTPCVVVYMLPEPRCLRVEHVHSALLRACGADKQELMRSIAGRQQTQQERRQAGRTAVGRREVADIVKVLNEPNGKETGKGKFKEDGEDGRRQERGRDGGPGICEDRPVPESASCRCGGVVRRRYWAQKEERDGVGGRVGKRGEQEGCRTDGVE